MAEADDATEFLRKYVREYGYDTDVFDILADSKKIEFSKLTRIACSHYGCPDIRAIYSINEQIYQGESK